MARDFAKAFYKTKAWRDCRDAYIHSVGGLCEDCLSKGIYKTGDIVHHVVILSPDNINDPSITLSWNNLKYVCRQCHADEHKRNDNRRYSIDDNGNVYIST